MTHHAHERSQGEIHKTVGDPHPQRSSPPPGPYCRLREGEREGSVPTGRGAGVGMPRDGSRK